MDPAGLLISIATVALVLDDFTENYSSASVVLDQIKSQVRVLESTTARIQEWCKFTQLTDSRWTTS